MALDLGIILVVFLAIAIAVTYLFKKLKIGDTYFIITLIRTKKFLPLFDKFKDIVWLGAFADLGLVMGFGAIAIDFLYGSKMKSKVKRLLLFISSFILLGGLFYALANPFIGSNPLVKDYVILFALAFGLMGFAGFVLVALAAQGYDIIVKLLAGKKACPGVAPIIPGIDIPTVPISVPVHAWLSLLIILIVHEGMHGLLARKAKVALKSAGLLLLGFLPIGAFVEPKDEDLAKRSDLEVARIYSSGPTANLVVFFLAGLFMVVFSVAVLGPVVMPRYNDLRQEAVEAVLIDKVDQNSSFCGDVYPNSAFGRLEAGDEVLKVNGTEIKTANDFILAAARDKEKIDLTFKTLGGETKADSFEKNELGLIGITVKEKEVEGFEYLLADWILLVALGLFASFFGWFILLNFLVATVNFLPTNPFDGGRIARIVFLPYLMFFGLSKQKSEKVIGKFFVYLVIILFIVNALPLFLL